MEKQEKQEQQQKRIVFFHPDLGIGGAERLVIDSAVGLKSLGHHVTIFTSHCDRNHCFTEARDGTLDVRVRGNTIFPPNILGRFAILCAVARQLHLVLSIAVFSNELAKLQPTDFFVDQLSACIPLLRLLHNNVRILFYCHFPDKLLTQQVTGWLSFLKTAYSAYRLPFDFLEQWSTACADAIVVNSKFTGRVVKDVFGMLMLRTLKVVYPCVDTSKAGTSRQSKQSLWPGKRVLLSINRFERKKDVALAIKAYAALEEKERKGSRLVLAGGYDPGLKENVVCLKELQKLATSLDLNHDTIKNMEPSTDISYKVQVLFLLSVSDELKQSLLDSATLLVYTPRNEHFGIVPLEAMLNSIPVLAANEGGPVETVIDDETGWLRSVDDIPAWTEIMRRVLELAASQDFVLSKIGEAGKARVVEKFSKRKMALSLNKCLDDLRTTPREPMFNTFAITAVLALVLATAVGIGLWGFLFYVLQKDADLDSWAKAAKASKVASSLSAKASATASSFAPPLRDL